MQSEDLYFGKIDKVLLKKKSKYKSFLEISLIKIQIKYQKT